MMTRDEAERIAQGHVDNGRILEAAWTLTALQGAPDGVADFQVGAMRACFFLGADYVMQILLEARRNGWTDTDLQYNMSMILKELDNFLIGQAHRVMGKQGQKVH
jgi:hypothetical protein